MEKRLLTPAEAGLLLAPGVGVAGKCIQAGLLSLLDAGRIQIERSSSLFRQSVLRLSSTSSIPLPSHLAALERALIDYGKGDRLVSTQVIQALQKRFGYGYVRYVHDELAPGLIERDLLTRFDNKWLWLFTGIRYRRTARGDALAVPLERLMAAIEELPSLIDTDPERAVRPGTPPTACRDLRTRLAEHGYQAVKLWQRSVRGAGSLTCGERPSLFGADTALRARRRGEVIERKAQTEGSSSRLSEKRLTRKRSPEDRRRRRRANVRIAITARPARTTARMP